MLNPDLDVDALGAALRERGRLQIADVLTGEAADTLHACLDREVPWRLAYIDEQGESRTMDEDELAALGDAGRARMAAAVHRRAREEFQFLYNSYMMVTAYKERRDPHLVLHRVIEYLNSPDFLSFARRLTGVQSIVKVDAQATRYIGGHFLKQHNDREPAQGREAAYVINLTRDWSPDWGGLLQFLQDGRVVDSFVPRFNTLSVFRVPAMHCVSYVAPFAPRPRYAITGWFRSR